MDLLNSEQQRFLEQSQRERKERELNRLRSAFATKVCAAVRGHLARKAFRKRVVDEFEESFGKDGAKLNAATKLLRLGRLLTIANIVNDKQVLASLCRALTVSAACPNKQFSFAALFLSTQYMKTASELVACLFRHGLDFSCQGDVDSIVDHRVITTLCEFMEKYSNPGSWELVKKNEKVVIILNALVNKMLADLMKDGYVEKLAAVILKGLRGLKTVLPRKSLNQLSLFLFRIAKASSWSDDACLLITTKVLTSPGYVGVLDRGTLEEGNMKKVLENAIGFMAIRDLSTLNVIEAVNLLGNLAQICLTQEEVLKKRLLDWTMAVNCILDRCDGKNVKGKYFHSVIGWTNFRLDEEMQAASNRVRPQIELLWSQKMIDIMFCEALTIAKSEQGKPTVKKIERTIPTDLKHRLMKLVSSKAVSSTSIEFQGNALTAEACRLYQRLLSAFQNTKYDLLSGLCRNEKILVDLWNFLHNTGLDSYWKLLSVDPTMTLPHFAPLELFAGAAHVLLSILDETELYEKQSPFTLKQLREIATFCNNFCFRCIWEEIVGFKDAPADHLFNSVYQLCSLLLMRDGRKSFMSSPSSWDVKSSAIVAEFERETKRATNLMKRMPHVITLKERILLFKRLIAREKEDVRSQYTTISIHRNRILEDGYSQLCTISPAAVKSTIRVKFLNEHGLPEAGIDQDGVFKEFLELTAKKVFDPGLNLFKTTENNLLYPSSTSYVHENHLNLFEYVGKTVGKAVIEGICVEVHFAPVLLAAVLKKQLCAFDELSSLDPELYKNLTFVKHYEGDVSDLVLTFAFSEEVLGQVKTFELTPGGSNIKVHNDNKIAYIHQMAHYRVVQQTREQCQRFVEGFRSIISPTLLTLFTTQDLQFLISGENNDIDIGDLRKHTQYFGGFHNNHRVIRWLWEILEHDFTTKERHLFLKFSTSCSRPPLLGFAYLEPPFSIRCVETSDDNDHGDTLGSVIRGFLTIRKKMPAGRLPTASTCFNLLKLPNYSKRSVLLEKLRYAIHAESGFELS